MKTAPVALTIAGSDSSAGAGIQADLKTFSAFGVYGLSAVTCVVAETPGHVSGIHAVSASAVRDQIDVLLANFPVAAAKTGLLHSAENVVAVAKSLRDLAARTGHRLALVIDPVMVATSGDPLLNRDAVDAYERELFPLAALVTPNLDEAAKLLDARIDDVTAMRSAGQQLVQKYRVPFLLKGGHLAADTATDLLFAEDAVFEFNATFTRGIATHGTGCTYSAAIAAGLARGDSLRAAIASAKNYVTRTIAQHFSWPSPDGREIHALNHSAARDDR